ncbi:MAG: diaminopimelate epimerase [Lachnospiraceae bacterium]|nr:diaminopimelate epimerase [Lachnospiraceae bacterium]
MKFTKMHGLGNDYVYVNCFKEQISDPSATAIRVSDRHFGIGSDGLILIKPSKVADFQMEMYNADGSLGAMCGNGIRCVAKYVYDYGLTDKTQISVETVSGIKYLDLTVERPGEQNAQEAQKMQEANTGEEAICGCVSEKSVQSARGQVSRVRVDMGKPILDPKQIPVNTEILYENPANKMIARCLFGEGESADNPGTHDPIIGEPFTIAGMNVNITCVSMGNPHCVVPVKDVDGLAIEKIGPQFENHPLFPDRVNTEFIKVLDRKTVQMRVWERGSGETLACGTGACAVAVACILNGWTEETVTVKLRGGDLQITWDRQMDTVYMTGPAVTVFDGEMKL